MDIIEKNEDTHALWLEVFKPRYDAFYEYLNEALTRLGREHIEERIAKIIAEEKANPDKTDKVFAFDVNYDFTYLKGVDAIRDFFGRFSCFEGVFSTERVWGLTEKNSDSKNLAPVIKGRTTFDEIVKIAASANEDIEIKTVVTYGRNGNYQWLALNVYGIDSGMQYAQHMVMIG